MSHLPRKIGGVYILGIWGGEAINTSPPILIWTRQVESQHPCPSTSSKSHKLPYLLLLLLLVRFLSFGTFIPLSLEVRQAKLMPKEAHPQTFQRVAKGLQASHELGSSSSPSSPWCSPSFCCIGGERHLLATLELKETLSSRDKVATHCKLRRRSSNFAKVIPFPIQSIHLSLNKHFFPLFIHIW